MVQVWGRRSSFNLQTLMWLRASLRYCSSIFRQAGNSGLLTHPVLAMNPSWHASCNPGYRRHDSLGVTQYSQVSACKVWTDAVLVRECIPARCKRRLDGLVGFSGSALIIAVWSEG